MDVDEGKAYVYEHGGQTIVIVRVAWRVAHARNGNTHNPTRYYRWKAYLNGVFLPPYASTRREAYWRAVQHLQPGPGSRRTEVPWWDVDAQMRNELRRGE